jgi:hypothetical protein
MIGPLNIFSASRGAIEVKVNAAGLMMIAEPSSIASWTHSISLSSLLVWRNSTGRAPAASRHQTSTSESVVVPVDFRLALAEAVEVGAVEDVERLFVCHNGLVSQPGSRTFSAAKGPFLARR